MEFSDELGECGGWDSRIIDDLGEVRKIFEGSDKLNIVHLNIRSLQKNFDELLVYLHAMSLEDIDVLVLSETFRLRNIDRFRLPNFDMFYNDSKFNKNYGCMIYVKKLFNASSSVIELTEVNVLRCTFTVRNERFGITGIYRPPSTRLDDFLHDTENMLLNFGLNNCEILVGDLNINILDETDLSVA